MKQHHLPKDTEGEKERKKTTEIIIIKLLQLYEGRGQSEENTISRLFMYMSCFQDIQWIEAFSVYLLVTCRVSVDRSERANGWKLMKCESRPKRMVNLILATAFRRSRTDVRRADLSSLWLRARHSGFHVSSHNWYCHTPYRILLFRKRVNLNILSDELKSFLSRSLSPLSSFELQLMICSSLNTLEQIKRKNIDRSNTHWFDWIWTSLLAPKRILWTS